MFKLVGTNGVRFYSYDLTPGKHLVGRQSKCDFFIDDGTVSRRHAELEINDSGESCLLKELGSHNGTFVNGTRLTDSIVLKDGDQILFGHAEFRLSGTDGEIGQRSGQVFQTNRPTTRLAMQEPEKSVLLPINEALRPLPSKVTDLPDVLPTIFEMARQLVLPEPQEEMLSRSLALIAKVIPAERLAVLFADEESGEVYTEAMLLSSGKDPGTFTLSKTIINEILKNKQSVLVGDPHNDPRFASQDSIIMSEMKAAMAVPLFDEGRVLGILYADTTSILHRYNDDYLRLMATFGNLLASKLSNYLLLNERHEKEMLAAELDRASNIQKNLLVATLPEIPGYKVEAYQQQCRLVGGDLYDVAVLPDKKLLFLVADVSGKGLGAALLMSNILASFRILYNEPSFNLVRAVCRVSKGLFSYSAPENFATLFIGLIDPETSVLHYVNAGHNPPLLIKPNGTVSHLEPSGILIGAFDLETWTEEQVPLDVGDKVLVFSDGVTEAEGESAQYSDERLERFVSEKCGLSSEELIRCLVEDIESFVGDTPRSDDITLLSLAREK